MSMRPLAFVLLLCAAAANASGTADRSCIRPEAAAKHRGEKICITGKVLKVSASDSGGATFLDFCEDYLACPFTVVVFTYDLSRLGDVRSLAGRVIEIDGKIEDYQGRAEIVLKDARQLRGDAARLPPVPKDYDVERRGNFSPGRMKFPRGKRKHTRHLPQDPSSTDVEQGDPGQ